MLLNPPESCVMTAAGKGCFSTPPDVVFNDVCGLHKPLSVLSFCCTPSHYQHSRRFDRPGEGASAE